MSLDWLKKRWLEYRFGYNYVGIALGLYQIIVLTGVFFAISRADLGLLVLETGIPFVIVTWMVGYLHKKYQQETDVMVSYRVVFAEYEKIIRKVLREERAEQMRQFFEEDAPPPQA